MKRMRMYAGLIVLVLSAAACGNAADPETAEVEDPSVGADEEAVAGSAAERLVPVRWAVSTASIGPAQSPYSSLPVELGYWEEEGLEVEVLGFAGSGAALQAIDADQADAGIAAPSSLFPAVAEGSDMIGFYDQVTRNFLVPGVPEGSDIETVDDMVGATIGVQSLESATVPMIRAMLQRAGHSPDSAEFVVIGAGAEALSFVERGAVDVIGLWDAPRAEMEEMAGIPIREIADEEVRELGFQYTAVAREAFVQEQRDVMVGLGRGIAKASVFAEENPEAAVRITWNVYPESRPTGVDEDEALAQGVRVLQARQENTQPIDGVWGRVSEDAVRDLMQLLLDAEVITVPVEVDDIWTDELLDEINDFDEEAVREQARNWTG